MVARRNGPGCPHHVRYVRHHRLSVYVGIIWLAYGIGGQKLSVCLLQIKKPYRRLLEAWPASPSRTAGDGIATSSPADESCSTGL